MSKNRRENFLRKYRDEHSRELKQLTATEFMEIWNHYDSDGNGFIDGKELDNFLAELGSSVNSSDRSDLIPDSVLKEFKEAFMDAYDENGDGKISVNELAEILPTEQNFLFLFRKENLVDASVDFMKIWKEFDDDNSGFIESNELRNFIKKLFHASKNEVNITNEKLDEYTQTILKIYDSNGDGKLQLSEMIKLLPTAGTKSLKSIIGSSSLIKNETLDDIFNSYDKDGNEMIDGNELDHLARDIMELINKDYTLSELNAFKNGLLASTDMNKDGCISKSELKYILLSIIQKSN